MRILDSRKKRSTFHFVTFNVTGQVLLAGGTREINVAWDVVTGAERVRFDTILHSAQFHPPSGRSLFQTSHGRQTFDPNTCTLTPLPLAEDYDSDLTIAPDADWAVCEHRLPEQKPTLRAITRFGEP